jgi:crossover junction endodeoxyribonuclease RuvC
MVKILSIDPGIVNLGYSILDVTENEARYINSGAIKVKDELIQDKLKYIYTFFKSHIEINEPRILVYEEPVFMSRGNIGKLLCNALGVIQLLCSQYNLDIVYYSAKTIKKTVTQSGNADKKQIEQSIKLILNEIVDRKFKTDHETDAIAIGLTYYLLGVKNASRTS